MKKSYLDEILKTSTKYLDKVFTKQELEKFLLELKDKDNETKEEVIRMFMDTYHKHIKIKFQNKDSPEYDKKLYSFLRDENDKVKIYWGDVHNFLKKCPSESIQLMVTSPPYYNAREYSQWEDLNKYLEDMKKSYTTNNNVEDDLIDMIDKKRSGKLED